MRNFVHRRRHETWRRNPYPVENHNCGINSPERETTETSDDLQQAWKELTNGGNDKESYATSTIQVSTNTFVDCEDFTLAHISFIRYRTR